MYAKVHKNSEPDQCLQIFNLTDKADQNLFLRFLRNEQEWLDFGIKPQII